MKSKYFIFLSAGTALLFAVFSFTLTIGKPAETIPAYYNAIMENLFSRMYQGWYTAETFPDTTIKISLKGEYANEKTYNAYPVNQCKSSPAYLYYSFYIPLDSNAYWNYASFAYDKKMQARFKKLFGADIISKRFPTKAQYPGSGDVFEFRFYNGAAIDAAFKKLYKKPTEKFRGISLQKIYNLTLKNYCRDACSIIGQVKKQDSLFLRLSKKYLSDAQNDAAFEGQTFTMEVCRQLGFNTESEEVKCIQPYYQSRIVGIMLRRQCDGSLPVLLNNLKIMIKDYDPEFYKTIKTKF